MNVAAYACWIVAATGLLATPTALVAQQAQSSDALNPAIRIVLRDSYKNLQNRSGVSLKSLSAIAPSLTPKIDPAKFPADQYAKMESLGLPVDEVVVDMQGRTRQQALDLADRLRRDPLVTSVEVDDPALGVVEEPQQAARTVAQRSPDFGSLTEAYRQGWDEVIPNFAIGGMNSVAAREYPGSDGSNVRMIMTYMNSNWLHSDLPVANPKFRLPGCNVQTPGNNFLAGIVFGTGKNGAIRGIVPNLKMAGAIATASDIGVVEAMPHLERGDVVVITEPRQSNSLNGPVICDYEPPAKSGHCSLPAISGSERSFNTLYEVVRYATEELGVHIIVNAGYGRAPGTQYYLSNKAVNLDDPFYQGRYDRNRYDDGAIYVGAADPRTGKFMQTDQGLRTNVGSRIDVFGWGSDVPSIEYGNGAGYYIGAPQAATAMVAGAVAQIQSIAFAKGLGAIPPKRMRQVIVETGHPLPNPDPLHPIGVMPDVAAAVKRLLGEDGSLPQAELIGPTMMESGGSDTFEVQLASPQELTYDWTVPSGFTGAAGNTNRIQLTAPRVEKNQGAVISVRMTHPDSNQTQTLSTPVLVKAAPLTGSVQGDSTIASGGTGKYQMVLDPMPAGNVRYSWSLPAGFTSADTKQREITITAPSVNSDVAARLDVLASGEGANSLVFSKDITVTASAAPADTEAPSTPGNFRVAAVTGTSVTLTWNAATDNVRVTHYQVRNEGGWLVKTVDGSTLTHTVEGLQPGTEYKYTVEAYDKVLNVSERSPMISATTSR